MTTESPFQPVHVAGDYGYMQVTPTKSERERGYTEAFVIVDFSRVNPDDGQPEFVYQTAVCTVGAAREHARGLHRYKVQGGEALNRLAISAWAEEIAASR